MGLIDFLKSLLGFKSASKDQFAASVATLSARPTAEPAPEPVQISSSSAPQPVRSLGKHFQGSERKPRVPVRLVPFHYETSLVPASPESEIVSTKPYKFAFPGPRTGEYLDLSKDGDERWLEYYGLPALKTPQDLADWLGISIGTLAWLTHRTKENHRAATEKESHYHYEWVNKKSGGKRLIEAPKATLKQLQVKILREILDQVPAHPKAHGFVPGRSIITNARPHVKKRFILKFDLKDFYPTVRFNRVVAIFRSLGFSREVSIWLGRLTTTALPWDVEAPERRWSIQRYWGHHLPQGAPTSPALANLSAFGLDVRLAGLADKYCLTYTRYADDLTFSGPGKSIPALCEFIPLVQKIIHAEKFAVNFNKRRVQRNNQRQMVAGVVVNQRPNITRENYDRLKAILFNCIKHGPQSQNRNHHEDFKNHLRGRIAHIMQLNPVKGQKLLVLYDQINW